MAISKVTGGGILDNTVTDADINSSKLNGVANSANNYTHPNHSGDVVSAADGAMTIQTDAVDISMLSATGTASNTTFLRGDNAWAAAGSTSASDLTSGTLPMARLSGTLPALNGTNLTAIPAAQITGTLPAISGANLTGIETGRKGRNIIINGGMAVAQRGTSTTSGAQAYLLDRFYTYQFNASGRTVSQSTDSPAEFSHSLKVQRAANNTATTDVYLSQPIESKNCVGTAGKKVTFSFWAKKGANWSRSSSVFPVNVTSGTGTNQSFMAGVTGGVTLINSSVTLTTSWAKYSFTSSAIVPTNSTQLIYQTISGWAGTAGSDDSFYITGIQLETGETATDFEHRSIGEELALCQRYYQFYNGNYQIHAGRTISSNRIDLSYTFPTQMRAAPSLEAHDLSSVYFDGGTAFNPSNPTVSLVHGTVDGFMIRRACSESVGANLVASHQVNFLRFSSEI